MSWPIHVFEVLLVHHLPTNNGEFVVSFFDVNNRLLVDLSIIDDKIWSMFDF